jgi:hypothetical protein
LKAAIGRFISYVWFGDYSSLYIELGTLGPGKSFKNGKVGNPIGEITIYMGFDWVAKENSLVIGGSKNSRPQYKLLASKLLNTCLLNAEVVAGSNHLQLVFTNNLTFITSGLENSEPEWSVSLNSPRKPGANHN